MFNRDYFIRVFILFWLLYIRNINSCFFFRMSDIKLFSEEVRLL